MVTYYFAHVNHGEDIGFKDPFGGVVCGALGA
jgi:hypothetical protein